MAARERVEFDVVGRDLGGSKAFRDVGDAADKAGDKLAKAGDNAADAGDKLKDTGDKAGGAGDKLKDSGDKATEAGGKYRGLAHDIEQVEGNVRRLAAEIDKTGNKDLIKDLDRQKRELRKLTRVKDLLPDMDSAGGQAAESFSAQFVQRIGPLLARAPMGGTGAVIGAAIAVPVVATLGAAVSGAIVGAVGVGGVLGGLKIAASDSRVQAAGKSLADSVMGDLEESGSRFVEPALAGIGIIRSAWSDVSGTVDSVFESTAAYVEPLARGVADAVREIAPGLQDAAEAAGPIIEVLSQELPEVGAALGDLFSTVADHADEGASAVKLLLMGMEMAVDVTAGFVGTLSEVYRGLVIAGTAAADFSASLYGWLPIIGDQVRENRDRMHELKDGLDAGGNAGSDAGTKIEGGLRKVDTAAATATVELESLNAAIKRMAGENISAEQANIRLEEAINRATAAGKANNAGISAHTPKALANRQALVGIAEAANASAEAIYKQTGSQELASAATARGRQKFIESARAMGASKTEAIALADKLFAIPNVKRTVTVTANTQPALDSARGVVARINNMHARIRVSAEPSGGYGGSAHTGDGYSTGYSSGGMVYGRGPKGVDSVRGMLAPGEGVLTAREVDSLGGARGFEQLRAAIRGQAAAPAPMLAGAGSGTQTAAGFDEERLYRAMVRALRTTAVVRDPGRTADVYSRGG